MLNEMLGWLRKTFWRHKWVYRNPYSRRCKVCGEHEESYCMSLDTWNRSWWETHNEGDHSKHWKRPND